MKITSFISSLALLTAVEGKRHAYFPKSNAVHHMNAPLTVRGGGSLEPADAANIYGAVLQTLGASKNAEAYGKILLHHLITQLFPPKLAPHSPHRCCSNLFSKDTTPQILRDLRA